MSPVEVFCETLRKLTAILEDHRIRFHLTGEISSAAYAEPRMTQDIDLVVDPAQLGANLDSVIGALETSDFLFDEATVRSAVNDAGMFQLLDSKEALKLDVYPREMIPGELDRSSTLEVFEGVELPIVSRFDAAASKLIWISKGGHKSRSDFRHLYRTSELSIQQAFESLPLTNSYKHSWKRFLTNWMRFVESNGNGLSVEIAVAVVCHTSPA